MGLPGVRPCFFSLQLNIGGRIFGHTIPPGIEDNAIDARRYLKDGLEASLGVTGVIAARKLGISA